MSGGSMGYFYYKVAEAADQFELSTELRVRLRSKMHELAAALHAVEWNDSGDGNPDEDELIKKFLGDK